MNQPRPRFARVALSASLLVLLAACGGGSDPSPTEPAKPDPVVPGTARSKALLIGIDGVQYAALQQAAAATRMPTLQGLGTLLPAYTGGVKGTTTQQQATDGPGWATLLTGTWADRHQIRSNYAGQGFKADSVFKLLKGAQAGTRTAAVSSWSGLPQLLRADRSAGYLDLAKDCVGDDTCVTSETSAAIAGGNYDLIVADYKGPQQVADVAGVGTDYQNALAALDRQLATVKAALAQRRQAAPNEDWLVIVTATHGLGATGVPDGIPVPSNLASFIVLDKTANLAATAPAGLPADMTPWYAYAGAADVTPTLLAHLGALPAIAGYPLVGGPLVGAAAVRQVQVANNAKKNGLVLSWTLPATAPQAITVLRDGAEIARLPGSTTAFEDTTMALNESGNYTYDYTVVADRTPIATRATLNYVKPVLLLPSVQAGLTHLFPLAGTLSDRIDNAQVFMPWVTGATPVYAATGNGPFDGTGSALLSTNYAGPTVCAACDGGFKIATSKVSNTTASFSFGFWFRSDATRSGIPVASNKNWASGNNAGLAIGQYGSALRFNLGRGGARAGDKDLSFSANTWAYVVMAIDAAKLSANFYVYDPVLGTQSASVAITSAYLAAMNGLDTYFTLNEDGDGGYGPNYRNGNAANTIGGRFDFSEFATWNRVLTKAEVESIARSGTSLTTLTP